MPWAIIRLAQRAGRVDRIGQQAERILCYSFLPADGVERILRLRARVRRRLHENAEVVGTDEAFFEGDPAERIHDLYHEKAGLLDDDGDAEIDLASRAYQIWSDAVAADPKLKKIIEEMPNVEGARPSQTRRREQALRYHESGRRARCGNAVKPSTHFFPVPPRATRCPSCQLARLRRFQAISGVECA